MRVLASTVVTIGLLALGGRGLVAQSGNDLFQQALVKERTDGNVSAAIALYQSIVQKHANDRALVARALVQLAGCYEKLGGQDAVTTYQRVLREFGDQKDSVATARTRLAALQSPTTMQATQITRLLWDNVNQWNYNVNAPSADGRYVSFTGDNGDLAVRDLVSGTTRYLTNAGGKAEAQSSLVSPDGRHVAYGWLPANRLDELRILPLSGPSTEPRIVHRDLDADENTYPVGWTPDGKSVLVLRELKDFSGQIALIALATGSLQVVKSFVWWNQLGNQLGGEATLSPDGRLIAYSAAAGPGMPARDIFLLAIDGSRETVAVQSPSEDRQPVWSPDGSQLLFLSNRTGSISLWSLPIGAGRPSGPPQLVRESVGRLLGMTRGRALFYVTGGSTTNIYNVDLDANTRVHGAPVLATDRFVNGNSDPAWSRDGLSLAYRRGAAVLIRSAKTGNEVVVATDLRASRVTNWFPDGRSLLVLAHNPEQRRTEFYRLDTITGQAELLQSVGEQEARLNGLVDLSRDGRSIFYVDVSRDPPRLLRFDLDTRRNVELRSGPVSALAVSPDGTELAFVESEWLSVMPVGGGEPRKALRRAHDDGGTSRSALAWTSDQRYLLFVSDQDDAGVKRGGKKLWRVPAGGGSREEVGLSGSLNSLTPDPGGHRLTYRRADNRPFELWALENFLLKPGTSK